MPRIPLTKSLSVEHESHILYFYSTDEAYIENAISFIQTGIQLEQHVIFIDHQDRYQEVLNHLQDCTSNKEYLHYIDSHEFYEAHGDVNFDRVLTRLDSIVEPYVKNKTIIRLWGHVEIYHLKEIPDDIHAYENFADITITELGYTTVCAYDARLVPTQTHLDLMKSHAFIMTDDHLVRSNLYKTSNQRNPTVFPSISVQQNLESEMDLYKQKLDFIHVVSHEVRNPLTVIKAYAALLSEDESDRGRKAKLEGIINYASAIDNELSHIINTEQMLSTDAVWQKTLTLIQPAIDEAVEMMRVKALTQNIVLETDIELAESDVLFANRNGIKLIVTNLLSNAIKYSTEGQRVYLHIAKDANQITIIVVDQGIGMSLEQQGKLFHKYEKMNHEVNGQGIGLFMVKQLVDHFNGTITVQSELGQGSTFTVSLPLRTRTSIETITMTSR